MCMRLDGDLRKNKLVELNSSMTPGHETRVQWRNKQGQHNVHSLALCASFFFLTDRLNQETEVSLIEMLLINHSLNMNFEQKKKKEK